MISSTTLSRNGNLSSLGLCRLLNGCGKRVGDLHFPLVSLSVAADIPSSKAAVRNRAASGRTAVLLSPLVAYAGGAWQEAEGRTKRQLIGSARKLGMSPRVTSTEAVELAVKQRPAVTFRAHEGVY